MRAFAGGAFDADVLDAGDDALVAQTHAELAPILGIDGPPVFARLHRWHEASPQYEVGHLARVARIAQHQASTSGCSSRQRLSRRRHARRDRGRTRHGRPRLQWLDSDARP
jgi:protoporphyrinogen oxidase